MLREEDIKKREQDLCKSRESHTKDVIAHKNNVNDFLVSVAAKEDQLDATKKALDEYAEEISKTAEEQIKTHAEHVKRKIELDEDTTDMNKAIEKAIAQHHELKAAVAAHQVNIDAHIEAQKALEHDQQKNLDFYNAVVAREAEIEPLKKKYEDGIAANAVEIDKIKDQRIEAYRLKSEADQRLQAAIQAEQRAKTELDKLESLKNDIHTKITKET